MKKRTTALAVGAAVMACCVSVPAHAAAPQVNPPGIQLEHLDRGLVAAETSEGVFLSWRLLATEVTGATQSGQTGTDFAVYRNGERIADVTDSTNFLDEDGDAGARYAVAALVGGQETDRSEEVGPRTENYVEIPLSKPAAGVTPAGQPYSYDAGDMSIGDMDGDGEFEYVVRWEPTNAKDVSQRGYTGNTYIDTYTMGGRLLHRIDLGVNIRSGEHYTQFMVYDFDGDGRSEMMMKTAPGTKTISYDEGGGVVDERFISLREEDVAAGYTNDDDYRLSAEEYHEHLVDTFRAWQEHPEVVAGRWPATLEEAFGIDQRYAYPLSDSDARALADYFVDEYAPSRSVNNKLREFEGFILDGPEYLTVFDGATGAELQTVAYEPSRGDDGLMWGDYAYGRIEPGNRVDRFLAGVAYLDGQRPSAIFARGYYTRSTIAAYNWDGEKLSKVWYVDSGHVPMSNPFNDAPHGGDGTSAEFGAFSGQGFHSLTAADVDGDGRHEIVYGSATIDDDGSLRYSSVGTLPDGSANPGATVKLGHGDQLHVTDIDPSRPGQEIFTVHEAARNAPYGAVMRDAETGDVLFGAYSGRDTGRGIIGDVRSDVPGIEVWSSMPVGTSASGLLSATGEIVDAKMPGTNMNIKWAADMTTQLVNGSGNETPTIDDWERGRLLTAEGTLRPTGHKNPNLVADVFGDWREELFVRTVDSSAIRAYFSTEVTEHKLATLLHDPQYRAEVARQNTTYNQPSYTSYYLASDMDFRDVPVPDAWTPGVVANLQAGLEDFISGGEVAGPVAKQLTVALRQAQTAVERSDFVAVRKTMGRFIQFLEQTKRPDTVTAEARAVLTARAQAVLKMAE
ncbi:rhamnogalacturonan lyase [Microbacterium sp. GXF0217]